MADVVVGRGFRFGAGGKGNVDLLRERAALSGCEVHPVEPVSVDGERISSTRVRSAVRAEDVHTAGRLLGRPFALSGLVMHGQRRGRELGVGTANVHVGNEVIPAHGVYAAEANGPMGLFPAVSLAFTRSWIPWLTLRWRVGHAEDRRGWAS